MLEIVAAEEPFYLDAPGAVVGAGEDGDIHCGEWVPSVWGIVG